MLIADAQVHIWAPNTPERPWLPGQKMHRDVPLGAEELLREMDAAGVQRAVLVPPSLDNFRNDLVLDAARQYPERFAVMGRLDHSVPAAQGMIGTWRHQPGMLGLRLVLTRAQTIVMLNEQRLDGLWKEAEKAAVPVMILITLAMTPLIDRIAEH